MILNHWPKPKDTDLERGAEDSFTREVMLTKRRWMSKCFTGRGRELPRFFRAMGSHQGARAVEGPDQIRIWKVICPDFRQDLRCVNKIGKGRISPKFRSRIHRCLGPLWSGSRGGELLFWPPETLGMCGMLTDPRPETVSWPCGLGAQDSAQARDAN